MVKNQITKPGPWTRDPEYAILDLKPFWIRILLLNYSADSKKVVHVRKIVNTKLTILIPVAAKVAVADGGTFFPAMVNQVVARVTQVVARVTQVVARVN